jgi:hypothetical protein
VYVEANQDQQALRTQLGQAREGLERLMGELHAIDGELADLSTERQQFRSLDAVCEGLEDLHAQGAAGLFWGGRASDVEGESHVRVVRGRLAAFQKRLDEIEARRQEVADEIGTLQESADFLADDLYDIEREAELRKLEWVPEREVESLPLRASRMPWARGGEEDERFRRTLLLSLLLSLLLGLLLPMIELPLPEPWEPIEVPERLTRLIEQSRPLPPPPPVQEETRPEEKEPEPTEELVKEEAAPKSETPAPAPAPKASSKGILAFREKFSSLAENRPAARLGAHARIQRSGEAASGRPTRSLVTTQASSTSGGINLASLSRDVGGGGNGEIDGVEIARVTSSIGSGGTAERPLSGGGPGLSRTDEEIQIVFDRHKAALYRLYNRELRRDPTLRGQIVLRLRIEPDGSVSLCEVNSSDMKAPQLAAQVVGRVKTFDFGAKEEVPPVTILYPIDFLPAT